MAGCDWSKLKKCKRSGLKKPSKGTYWRPGYWRPGNVERQPKRAKKMRLGRKGGSGKNTPKTKEN